ncbi:hypothetical protein B0A48_10195 [Cryoendolithus antarcticus]|uniref:Peroxin-3 n=1 Tax=Cryoendolithus antarcticus TaxID=1507870 RepID=A0A1V8SWW4_9PEZI|nr:hypothetical protein B0A48_10195 [Cryoendolithus antarcticus]
MIDATRRWFRRNRTNLFIGAGVIGAGYVAGQYVIGKIQDARRGMAEERTAKENLRRRFAQNQEDCTYTVLALLPTVRDELMGELPVEQITEQLQQERQERLRKMGASQSEAASSELPSAPPSVLDDGSSGSFVHASQMVGSMDGGARPRRTKAQLWQEMKINSIARAITCLYTLALLTLLTRIQLNLLGRRTYLSSVVSLATPATQTQSSTISLENHDDDNYDNVYGNDFETNRKYLTFSWWLLHRGSRQIMERVLTAVREVFNPVNIREDMTLPRTGTLLMQIREKVEGATPEARLSANWLADLLPPKDDELFVLSQSQQSADASPSPSPSPPSETPPAISAPLRRLLDETSDLIDSPTFHIVLTNLLDAGFSHLTDDRLATEAFAQPPPATLVPRITELPSTPPPEATRKLATILPVFCRQAHAMLVGSGELDALSGGAAQEGLGNGYLNAMNNVGELESFAAVVYSSNFESEVVEQQQEREKSQAETSPLYESGELVDAASPDEDEDDVLAGLAEREAAAEPVPTTEPAQSPPAFEQAWRNAIAAEDGQPAVQPEASTEPPTHASSSFTPAPVDEPPTTVDEVDHAPNHPIGESLAHPLATDPSGNAGS